MLVRLRRTLKRLGPEEPVSAETAWNEMIRRTSEDDRVRRLAAAEEALNRLGRDSGH